MGAQVQGHDRHRSPDQKDRVLELLWEVAYADGGLDGRERRLVRRVASLKVLEMLEAFHQGRITPEEYATLPCIGNS